jgi:hypothetical protein
MKIRVILSATLALFSSLMSVTTNAQNAQAIQGPGLTSDIQDPVVELQRIRQKRGLPKTPEYSLFGTSPLTPLRERGIAAEKRIYKATDIKFGTNINTLFQGLSDEIQGEDDFGMSSFVTFVSTWDGYRKGCPDQGELTLGLKGR